MPELNSTARAELAGHVGDQVCELMESMVTVENAEPSFEVDEGTLNFSLNTNAGLLEGAWEVVVRKVR